MTAINVFIHQGEIHIGSDTAGTDKPGTEREGRFVQHIEKVMLLPKLNAALIVRGNLTNALFIHRLFGSCFATFDDLWEGAVEALRSLTETLAAIPGTEFDEGWDVVVAGFDESGPVVGLICNHALHVASGVAPWVWFDVPPPGLTMPAISHKTMLAAIADPVPHLAAVLDEQRRGQATRGEVVNVGGRAVHTVVSAAGVSSRMIGEWPDEVGEKLSPKAVFREAMAAA